MRFVGGREVVGTLKGFDGLVNVVLDDTTEFPLPDAPAGSAQRYLGLVVCRGTNVTVLGPDDGMVEIANPFVEEEAADEAA